MAHRAKPAQTKVAAKRPPARKPRKSETSKLRELDKRLAEALEQQTATSDILRVISRSPTDVQPVFDTIAAAVLKLCRGTSANVVTFDGKLLHVAAQAIATPGGAEAVARLFPRPLSRDNAATRAVLTCSVVMIPDVLADAEFAFPDVAIAGGFRSILAVPLVRQRFPIGAIVVGVAEPGPFADKQVALLKTFADQAVIAIENVRLFRELELRNRDLTEALEQQTATSEILSVISKSQTDVQPVFDTIVRAALDLCRAHSATVLTFDGELLSVGARALADATPEEYDAIRKIFPRPAGRETAAGRAVLTRELVAIPDVLEDPEYENKEAAINGGFRSAVAIPLLRDGNPIGTINVGLREPGPFPAKQMMLLQTFADQAVIAIENVRLFKALEDRNRDLTEALEHQTATSEILRVISSSPTDVQPVFDLIAERAGKLCDSQVGVVSRVEGDQVHVAALHGVTEEAKETIRDKFPMPLNAGSASARAIRDSSMVHITDVLADPDYEMKDAAVAGAWRNCLAVPMLREEQVIGAIFVGRADPGRFAGSKIELLKTFADQAVIAIENVRLFNELKTRTAELTQSVKELRALGEVGQAVSSTLDLETVLRTIVSHAAQLAEMDGGSIWEYDEAREEFHLHATDRLPDELIEVLRATPIRKREGALGRLAVTGEPVEIRDIMDEGVYQSRVRDILVRLGYRSLLAVPLLREEHLLGALAVNRRSAGEFAPHVSGVVSGAISFAPAPGGVSGG